MLLSTSVDVAGVWLVHTEDSLHGKKVSVVLDELDELLVCLGRKGRPGRIDASIGCETIEKLNTETFRHIFHRWVQTSRWGGAFLNARPIASKSKSWIPGMVFRTLSANSFTSLLALFKSGTPD